MRRREFIAGLGGAAAWPLPVRAQQVKLPRIGVLIAANPEPIWTEFQSGLRERGYTEGQNIALEVRSADGRAGLLRGLADELVRLKVDVLVALQTPAATAARQATSEIPIVIYAGDPVGTGLISSLARPGGNITGVSATTAEIGAKTLELIREVLPSAQHVAVLANASDPFSIPFVQQIEEGGRVLAIAIQTIKIRGPEEFGAAFATMEKEQVEAVIVQPSLSNAQVLDLALKYRLPAFGPNRLLPREGGFMSYSANTNDAGRRVALFVDRILNGAKPIDLPVEQPTKYELVINLKTAKALGLTVPPTLLARADEVIE